LYRNAQNVMLYYPTKYEMNLLKLLEDNKNFYLPKVEGKNLLVCPYKTSDKLIKSAFNILEPDTIPVKPEILDLIIVPALSVDNDGYRLGYGGGFYDRFLGVNLKSKTLCALPKQLITDHLPHEDFDIPVDIVITN